MADELNDYLRPEIASGLGSMELVARFVVEGFISGLHKSPYHGFSVEFAEHRQYMPGDDLRYLDWKVLGRTDRYYVKRFIEETNLKSYLIVDASRSMAFSSPSSETSALSSLKKLFTKKISVSAEHNKIISKLEYSTYLAASISVLMNFQKDAAGLVIYNEDISEYIPPKATSQNLKLILTRLAQ